jgi:exosortase D (VPLPA-CTERM-specific)
VGLLWLHLGGQKIKQIGFALFMMLTMFPFPGYINNQILLKLKIISSQLGVVILQLCGMSAYREGNVIDLGFTQLQVVDACSGLRYVMPLMVLSLILAHWFKAAIWKKAVLVLSSLPLAIVVNSFRIAMTGIIYSVWGAAVAESFFHGFSGWLIFIFTLPALLLEMWVLNRGFRGQGLGFRGQETEIGSQESEVRGQEVGIRSLMQPVFITTVVLIITTFVISMGIDSREKIPIKKSFNEFPLSVAEWQGRRQMMERKFLDLLHLSEYIMVNYRNSKGQDIDFYVAYNESQSKGEATHSPETCLPGGGWIFKQSGMVMIPTGNDRTIVVSRAFIEQSGSQELMYFWFPQRGRILTSLYQVKLYSFWDTLTKQRTDGALVRIITPVYGNEGVKDAEARIQEFTKEIVPVLDGFLP